MKQLLRWLISAVLSLLAVELFDRLGLLTSVLADITYNNAELAFLKLGITVILALVLYFTLSRLLVSVPFKCMSKLEDSIVSMPLTEFYACIAGSLIGLIFAVLLSLPIRNVPYSGFLSLIVYIIGMNTGSRLALRKKDEFLIPNNTETHYGKPKILDTSVIIDGRILDILSTGFIEGKIIIPNFVLEELRHIADSSDTLKRSRGRLGLDVLNHIKNQVAAPVEIVDWDSKKTTEVDSKLIEMAAAIDAFIVTNDFNLNKVAEFRKVAVLNINELSNAVKAIVLPGQEMKINVVKDGKEANQGIAYLNDGTMIVVENGRLYIGEEITITVTSVLQTSAGRMIFAKPLEN